MIKTPDQIREEREQYAQRVLAEKAERLAEALLVLSMTGAKPLCALCCNTITHNERAWLGYIAGCSEVLTICTRERCLRHCTSTADAQGFELQPTEGGGWEKVEGNVTFGAAGEGGKGEWADGD